MSISDFHVRIRCQACGIRLRGTVQVSDSWVTKTDERVLALIGSSVRHAVEELKHRGDFLIDWSWGDWKGQVEAEATIEWFDR